MCPYKSYCQTCYVNDDDYDACARYKGAGIKGIEAVPADLKTTDYHKLPELCLK